MNRPPMRADVRKLLLDSETALREAIRDDPNVDTRRGPAPIHAQPEKGYIAGNCKNGKHSYCFTLKCTCKCHKAKV